MLSLCAQQRVTLKGPQRISQQGPVSLPPGIKTGNILSLMASDSPLQPYWSFGDKCRYRCGGEGCSTGFYKKDRTEGG